MMTLNDACILDLYKIAQAQDGEKKERFMEILETAFPSSEKIV